MYSPCHLGSTYFWLCVNVPSACLKDPWSGLCDSRSVQISVPSRLNNVGSLLIDRQCRRYDHVIWETPKSNAMSLASCLSEFAKVGEFIWFATTMLGSERYSDKYSICLLESKAQGLIRFVLVLFICAHNLQSSKSLQKYHLYLYALDLFALHAKRVSCLIVRVNYICIILHVWIAYQTCVLASTFQ